MLLILGVLLIASSKVNAAQDDVPPAPVSARLPQSLYPANYRLEIQPTLEPPWDILGTLNLTIRVINATSSITLNMLDIVTLNETAKVLETRDNVTREVQILNQNFDQYRQMYTAELKEPLTAGANCTFFIKYKALLNYKLVGFYRSKYTTQSGKTRWLASTQFSPTDARRAFPGFDEPLFKSTFDITLVHPSSLTAQSNMPVKQSKMRTSELRATQFLTTPIMSTFIVVFHISDLVPKPVKSLPTTNFTVWARTEALPQTQYAYDTAPKLLAYLESFFNMSYFLPKLHMIAIPDFKFNAMENWGLITYRETAMLVEGPESSPASVFQVAYIMAHELSHQWFGNLVTPSWWSELWLKEGFASFMGYLALSKVEEDWSVMEKFLTTYQQSAQKLDSLATSHPINVPVDHPNEISEIFDAISYQKGASVIRMLYHFVGPDVFRQALSSYLLQLEFKSANQNDLWRHMSASATGSLPRGVTVETIMDTWTYQKGYPVVRVDRTSSGFTLSQEQFLIGSTNQTAAWWVPVSYTTAARPDFSDLRPKLWLENDAQQTYSLNVTLPKHQWFLANLQGAGFYRVDYDSHNWALISEQLTQNHSVIPVAHRAQLIDDVLAFAKSGRQNYSTALRMLSYLGEEDNYVAWEAASNGFLFLYKKLMHDAVFGDLKAFLLSLVSPWYERLGFRSKELDSYPVRMAREDAVWWACLLGHEGCLAEAVGLFRPWIGGANDTIPGFVRQVVICSGVSAGDAQLWDEVWQKYLVTSDPAAKLHILKGLTCAREPWLLGRLLQRAFSKDGRVRKHDATSVFASVLFNPIGRDIGWRFLRTNWLDIVTYLGATNRGLARLFESAKSYLASPIDVAELRSFKETYAGSLAAAQRAIEQAEESGLNSVEWRERSYADLSKWLTTRIGAPRTT